MRQYFAGKVIFNAFCIRHVFIVSQVGIRHWIAVDIGDGFGFWIFVPKSVNQCGDKGLVGFDFERLGIVRLNNLFSKGVCPVVMLRLP